ncbi:EAL and HDOD domain-containing protein [Ureibacillus thermosphaericus]|jgi:c-di-GMP phosphodiesterase|uniref:EAL and HDOD domain-containing protein n=1 Tax=Ureibacillus thermosphaericus TaxID=51173 RepID=UPI0002D9B59D|nr:HDOD domain-containing protein [Ureibacillus thermosphaericus]
MEVLVGRQPIFNTHEEVVAYELLYRRNESNQFEQVDSDNATIQVLKNSVFTIGMNELTNGLPGFVNFTENLLMTNNIIDLIDPSTFVIEILEDVPITDQLIMRIVDLRNRGFTIALDDFVLRQNIEYYNTLFANVDIIKVDFLSTPKSGRAIIEERVKNFFPHIQLLAEKVENRTQFEEAKAANYSLFQGYFFEQPQIIKSVDIPMNMLQYFEVMSLLKEENSNVQEIAEKIEQNISITYKLLQLINNISRKKSKVRSVKQAIVMLGLIELRKFLYLLAVDEGLADEPSDVYIELMRTSIFRAKICELLARKKNKQNYSEYYLVGMFSLIDTILQRPIQLIVQQLPFSEVVIETICGRETEMTIYLQLSIALTKMDLEKANQLAKELGISTADLGYIYRMALEYTKSSI